jgi:hypothetical protein
MRFLSPFIVYLALFPMPFSGGELLAASGEQD